MTGWIVFMAIISCDILMCSSEARQNQQMEATPCLFVHPTEEGAHLIRLHSFMLTSLQPADVAFWLFSSECQLRGDFCFLQGTSRSSLKLNTVRVFRC